MLFVILWARPPRLSECLTLQYPSRWGRSNAHRAPLGHRLQTCPAGFLVEACPTSPRSQPRPAPAPLFCAAPPAGHLSALRVPSPQAASAASGQQGGKPSPQAASAARGARWLGGSRAGFGGWSVRPAGVCHSCRGLPLYQMFTNVIANCKPVQRQRAPVKYYGGFPPSPPSVLPYP